MYRERPSVIDGAVVWAAVATTTSSRVLPDGCMDLLWDGASVRVAGPDTTAHLHTTTLGAALVGLRFAPGAAPAVLGLPAHELTDRQVPLDDLWARARVDRLADRLAAATDAGAALEAFVLAEAGPAAAPGAAERHVVARLVTGATVDAVAAELGISRRQLHRRSLVSYGYGPKHLARILRFRRALALVDAGAPLAGAAAHTGYADQAHLARDARDLAGVPISGLR